jgi:ferrochelatase
LHAGGKNFNYIPCLNNDPAWVEALADIALQHMQGWPTLHTDVEKAKAANVKIREHALSLGAKD